MPAPDRPGWLWCKPHGERRQFVKVFRCHPEAPKYAEWGDSLIMVFHRDEGPASYVHYRRVGEQPDKWGRRVSDVAEDDREKTPITICWVCGVKLGCWMCEHFACSQVWARGPRALLTLAGCSAMLRGRKHAYMAKEAT